MKIIALIIFLFIPSSCSSSENIRDTINQTLSPYAAQIADLFKSGHKFRDKRQYEEAIREYTKILKPTKKMLDNANHGLALSFIGSSYYGLKDYKKAIEFVVELPTPYKNYYDMGQPMTFFQKVYFKFI